MFACQAVACCDSKQAFLQAYSSDTARRTECLHIPAIHQSTRLPTALPKHLLCAPPVCLRCLRPGDIDCLAEFARASSQGVNDYDDEGQAPLHVAADKGISEAVGILTGAQCRRSAASSGNTSRP
jgi:hypothetical protein